MYEAPRPIEPPLSRKEAARVLGGVSVQTVIRLLDRGELTRIRIGRRVLVDPQSIRDYLERQRELR